MEVDPWAVVVRRGRWFLVCWSHTADALRTLRVDRIVSVHELTETFDPPDDLDPMRLLEEHLATGWELTVEVVVEAPVAEVEQWVSRSLGRLEPAGGHTRLVGSTQDPAWYAVQLVPIRAPFHVVGPPELQRAVTQLGSTLVAAGRPVTS